MLSLTLWIVLAAVVILIAFLFYIYTRLPKKIPVQFRGKHAFITGGSKGIGKELAIGLIKRGCNVSISARDAKQLQLTCDELRTVAQSTAQAHISARWYQLDVTDSFEKVEAVILKAEKECGKEIDILINNAGTCIQGAFDELSTEAFQLQFSLNCLSSIKTTHALVKRMKSARNGHIGFVCSAAGQFAMFGYSAYSMSKFALRGFAESLRMELLPYNIGVSLLYPPNTSTEGYQEELKTMPDEVREISGVAGLFTARHVAECYLNDMASGNISTSIGLEGWMLNAIASATSMENNFLRVLLELILLVPIRIIMLIYMSDVNKIVDKCRSKRQSCNTSTNGPSVNGDS